MIVVRGELRPLHVTKDRCVYIGPGIYFNLVLRELHDQFYPAPMKDTKVHFVMHPDALVLSVSPDEPAMRTGFWP